MWLTRGAASAGATSSGGSGAGASRETLQAVTDWVKANGPVVAAGEYGGSTEGNLNYLGG